MTATEWRLALENAMKTYVATRQPGAVVVRIYLDDGEAFELAELYTQPVGNFLLLAPYPDDLEDMVDAPQTPGTKTTPRMVIVEPHRIRKVELLIDAPGRHEVGFRASEETPRT